MNTTPEAAASLEAARYAADRAFGQYDAADPANRLVTVELEARWNKALAHAAEVEAKITIHDAARPVPAADPATLASLAADLKIVWTGPTTDARLKKRIVRTLIHEVVADIDDAASEIVLIVHWVGVAPIANCACRSAGVGSATAPLPISSKLCVSWC